MVSTKKPLRIIGDDDLVFVLKKVLRHPRFAKILNKKFCIKWTNPSVFELNHEAWAHCYQDNKNVCQIRLNTFCKDLKAPRKVISYLIKHETIHFLPGCNYHNSTFWDHEISIVGPEYYEAAKWLKKNGPLFRLRYAYRSASWLVGCVDDYQMSTRDMAEVCGVNVTTIRRWLKRYQISIS